MALRASKEQEGQDTVSAKAMAALMGYLVLQEQAVKVIATLWDWLERGQCSLLEWNCQYSQRACSTCLGRNVFERHGKPNDV